MLCVEPQCRLWSWPCQVPKVVHKGALSHEPLQSVDIHMVAALVVAALVVAALVVADAVQRTVWLLLLAGSACCTAGAGSSDCGGEAS